MKKIKILSLLLLTWAGVQGQGYMPLLDTDKVWNIFEDWIYWGETYPHFLEVCETDSTRYVVKKELYGKNHELGYLFEDTATGKVHYTDLYDNEVLLYDFGLEEGDVFEYLMVTAVDSIQLLDGSYRKRIIFEDGYNYWIEGMGSIKGGLLWVEWHLKKHIPEAWVLCFYENDSLLYMNEDFEHFDTCDLSFTDNVEETTAQLFKPTIYPNPFHQEVSISFDQPVHGDIFEVMIMALDGRTVYSETHFSETSIDLSFLGKGIYLMVIRNNDFQYSEKIIKL